MLKGVNRQVLEITGTDNPYFEKIIFFVKPEFVNEDGAKLKTQAEKLAQTAQKPPRMRKSKREMRHLAAQFAICLAAGAVITLILNYVA
jgi:hypothetical protein